MERVTLKVIQQKYMNHNKLKTNKLSLPIDYITTIEEIFDYKGNIYKDRCNIKVDGNNIIVNHSFRFMNNLIKKQSGFEIRGFQKKK